MKNVCELYDDQLLTYHCDDESGVESMEVRNTEYLIIFTCHCWTITNLHRCKKVIEEKVISKSTKYPVIIDGKKYRIVGNFIEE